MKKTYCFIGFLFLISMAGNGELYGQEKQSIKGVLRDQSSNLPIAYATVALYNLSDSTFITGTTTVRLRFD